MRKRLILLAGLLAAALVVLGAFLASTISPEKLRALLDAELEARLGRPVELGRVSPSLFPPGARLRGLRVRDPSGGPDLARAERVSLRVRFWPLLRGEVRLAKLSVSKPEIRLVRDREGHLNIEDLLRGAREEAPPRRVPSPPTPPPLPGRRSTGRREGAPSPGPPAPPGGGGVLPFFFVRQLTLSDGVVVFEDQLQRERSLRLDSVDLSLRGRSLAGPFELTLSARLFPGIDRLPRLKASQLQVQGEVEPRAGAPPLVRGELRLASLPLGLFRHWLPRVDLFVSGGSLSLLAHVRSDGESLEGEGELTLEGSVLKAGGRAGARLPLTAFSFRGGAGP
ncbi:MAG: AsmA family protein, partial [Nitrospinota bacterium]